MDAKTWKKIKSTFDAVVELSPGERSGLLANEGDEIRREVEKMLAADDEDLIVHSPAFRFSPGENGSKPPERIKQFKIEAEIGRGGMGAVYLARRDDGEFDQKVAIKLIKRGMDSDDILRRFRTERQILAELQHENIARLFDGGVTDDGLPFYVMEYIDGVAIDDYCKSTDLDLPDKLTLFRKVCAAVSYAHGQLVVHRDLKPSNILVCADGTPKLLDFGIAKILNATDLADTVTALGVMTPAYASPEQIRGEKISTASDVYSLGIIFYELLTGERPFRTEGKSYAEILEMVGSTEAVPPSIATAAIARPGEIGKSNLKGDLDTIALKALQKNPDRRYASVEQFSEDLRRYGEGLPISARPDNLRYRIDKFVRRNKIPVAASAFIVLALCFGIAVALWQARRAETERAVAQKRFDQVRQLANRVVFTYHDAIADLPGSTKVREMLVADALQYLDQLAREASGDANLQLELGRAYLKLGDVQGKMYNANVGDSEGALESYHKAIALFEAAVKSPDSNPAAKDDLIGAYDNLAFLLLRTGGLAEARSLIDKALSLHHQTEVRAAANPARTLRLIDLNIRYLDMRELTPESLEARQELMSMLEPLLESDPNDFEIVKASSRLNQRIGTDNQRWAEAAQKTGDSATRLYYEQSLSYHEKSLSAAEHMMALAPERPDAQRYLTTAHGNVAEALAAVGRTDEALKMAEKFEALAQNALRSDPGNQETNLLLSNVNEIFANIYLARGDLAQAIKYNLKALSIDEAIYRSDPQNKEVLGRITERRKTLASLLRQNPKQ